MSTMTDAPPRLSLSEKVASFYSRYFPDSLIFALILTLIAMVLALIFTDAGLGGVGDAWYGGFPMLFEFAFQLSFTYAAALVLVDTPVVQRVIRASARLVKTPQAAYIATGLLGALTSFLGWYIGPVVTAIFARSVAKEMDGVDYRLISAIAYSSFVISLTGVSGTIPLFVATEGPLTELIGGIIPLSHTTFTPMNLISGATIVATTTIVFWIIARNKKQIVSFKDMALPGTRAFGANDGTDAADAAEGPELMGAENSFAERVNTSRIPLLIAALVFLAILVQQLVTVGLFGMNLNTVALVALVMGMLVQKNAIAYATSFGRNLVSTGSIMLQFPLYGGIAGIFAATGLAGVLTDALVSVTPGSLYLTVTFLVTGLLNLFVPSAGSQVVATAPFLLPAGQELGVSTNQTIMAIMYGDIWTNLIQPFWALLYYPILAVGTSLKVRDFMGYCLPMLIAVGIIWILALNFLPLA
jgi:short-chain fatty acids transporter